MKNNILFDPMWILGFVDGEGCFHVAISKNSTMRLGYQVLLEFSIVQNNRDKTLLLAFIDYFNCGVVKANDKVKSKYQQLLGSLQKDLTNIIIPFFDKHPLLTKKQLDYLDFKLILEMMNRGEHLTENGLIEIRKIKSKMNRNRTFEDIISLKYTFKDDIVQPDHISDREYRIQGCVSFKS